VVAGAARAAVLTEDGEMLLLPAEAAGRQVHGRAPLLVHAPATLKRLGLREEPCLDLLELFAFVRPARGVAPTPRGLALALDMKPPAPGLEAAAAILPDIAEALLSRLSGLRGLPAAKPLSELAARSESTSYGV
jgi:ATP-dependent DNA helicase DinG